MFAKLMRFLRGSRFDSSATYWERRYRSGGNSGAGSYSILAEFKAEVLNAFVREHDVRSVIEFGCGDGNQLTLAQYPAYIGYDVSQRAVDICRSKFAADATKSFERVDAYDGRKADLALSLDVIFHLVEDAVFDAYMRRLFDAGGRFIGIYASNDDRPQLPDSPHVRHRRFTDWIDANAREWTLERHVPNRYPDTGDNRVSSFADFYFYRRVAA
ncbi:class I SAM-dependent methyltransferase [Noviluteimonas gilva]|uniref:Methyltransferase domain-containing protein n=1 Tax=Noviluteimonas gilva TaxID=2682097 RepID=A0A7C9LMD2_9GAMM|nr:class I SAM-dependent methyltransferase [Lysobacter gilvus]MUV13823.1 methyltransferase domain-containing protein [Lysobacter gilvus]